MSRLPLRVLLAAGLLLAFGVAGVLSWYASSHPDGLQRVASDHGFAQRAADSPADSGPFAGYQVKGVEDHRLSTGLAGVAGTLTVLVLAGGLFLVVRRPGPRIDARADARAGRPAEDD